ncbi:MAG: histidine kinase [Lachnospiraceae bacterium]|nr:histidine kinase [Lachnospiraceae bacterium]
MDQKKKKFPNIGFPKTFQFKLILYNFMVIICIAATISFYNYHSYRNDVIANETKNSQNRLFALSDRMEVAYHEMVNIIVNCAERKSLFFASSFASAEKPHTKSMQIYAFNVLRDFCAISGYSEYIHKITLYYDGMVLQSGTANGSGDDVENIMGSPWFPTLLAQKDSNYTLFLAENPFSFQSAGPAKILPLLRPLNYRYPTTPENSWIFLGISPKLFSDTLSRLPQERILYITTADGDVLASLNGSRYDISGPLRNTRLAIPLSGQFQSELNGDDCVITYQKQQPSGLIFMEVLPVKDMNIDHMVVIRTILITFFFCIAIGLILSLLVSRQLGTPIKRLTRRLQCIAQGNFERDYTIETNDEIGEIGRQINQMSGQISNLMETRVRGEKEKKDLEIKMLQAQINPHFLYNTLDSIKWIATMQKNSGIVQVVTALSSLLKNMAKGFNEKVTLKQELDFLNNYVTIEKIRYIELFDVDIQVDSDALYQAKIIKLTLQPLVENAIFNGIEPSGRTGLIKIHACTKNSVLYISVTDNGIGISPKNIEKLLTDTSRITRSNMSGIGLPNVDRRLKLVYGEAYGVTIESEIDQYTTITVALPLEF